MLEIWLNIILEYVSLHVIKWISGMIRGPLSYYTV